MQSVADRASCYILPEPCPKGMVAGFCPAPRVPYRSGDLTAFLWTFSRTDGYNRGSRWNRDLWKIPIVRKKSRYEEDLA